MPCVALCTVIPARFQIQTDISRCVVRQENDGTYGYELGYTSSFQTGFGCFRCFHCRHRIRPPKEPETKEKRAPSGVVCECKEIFVHE